MSADVGVDNQQGQGNEDDGEHLHYPQADGLHDETNQAHPGQQSPVGRISSPRHIGARHEQQGSGNGDPKLHGREPSKSDQAMEDEPVQHATNVFDFPTVQRQPRRAPSSPTSPPTASPPPRDYHTSTPLSSQVDNPHAQHPYHTTPSASTPLGLNTYQTGVSPLGLKQHFAPTNPAWYLSTSTSQDSTHTTKQHSEKAEDLLGVPIDIGIGVPHASFHLPQSEEESLWEPAGWYHVGMNRKGSQGDPNSAEVPQGTIEHRNSYTGQLCDCPWGASLSPRTASVRLSGEHLNRVYNQAKRGDKKLASEEGQNFLKDLGDTLNRATDPAGADQLAPYLAQRWKKGDIIHTPGHDRGPLHYQRRDLPSWSTEEEKRDLLEIYKAAFERRGVDNFHDYVRHPAVFHQFYQPLSDDLDKWNEWYHARNHPTRQGVNLLDKEFDTRKMGEKVREHQTDLKEKRFKEDLLPQLRDDDTTPVKQWNDGWSIHQLNDKDALYHEGKAMRHCIGNPGQPYIGCHERGDISVYSLRDPEGWPHGTWHTNNNRGGVAEVFGRSDKSLKPEYQARYEEWARENGYNPKPVGHHEDEGEEDYEDEEEHYEREVTVPDAEDVDTYLHYRDGGYWDVAADNHAVNEDTAIYYDTNHGAIFEDALRYNQMNELVGSFRQDPYERGEFIEHAEAWNRPEAIDNLSQDELEQLEIWNNDLRPHINPYTNQYTLPQWAPGSRYISIMDQLQNPLMQWQRGDAQRNPAREVDPNQPYFHWQYNASVPSWYPKI